MDGNDLVVNAEHEELREGESVYRQLKRRVHLPEGITKDALKCHIDHHGHLMVEADKEPKRRHIVPMDRYTWPAGTYVPPFLPLRE